MLAPFALAVVGITVLITSFVSGLFGMAGGMMLLGVLLVFMDVAPAMVLFGVTQMASNGWRATLWWRHVQWSIVWRFLVGSTTVFLLMRSIAILPRHHAPRRPLRGGRHHHRAAAAGGCRRPHPRRVLPEEPARP
ncbi:MAG: sulfite exporter TauE/SafE family protein [Alphaproteobacteria bacterium]|nr:MAG: sulfite exporter TauE/SafE family protein [Alphaproteobacteria bacterium]